MIPLTLECQSLAAQALSPDEAKFGLPAGAFEKALNAVRQIEGGRVGAVTINRDAKGRPTSEDIGPFQINTVWLPAIARSWGLASPQAAYVVLRDHGCANALAAAQILRLHFDRTGNLGIALGDYHSRTPLHAEAYRQKLVLRLLGIKTATGAKQ